MSRAMLRKVRIREGECSRVAEHTVRRAIRKSRACGVIIGVAEVESFVECATFSA